MPKAWSAAAVACPGLAAAAPAQDEPPHRRRAAEGLPRGIERFALPPG